MTREELYKMFGPMLLEAVVLLTLQEINELREECGLPLRTKEQLQTAIGNKLETLSKYNWMDNQ